MVHRVLNILLVMKMLKKLDLYAYFFQTRRRDFDETKCMSFLIQNDELLANYDEIWENVKNSI